MNRDERKKIARLLVQQLWCAGFLDAEILGGGTKVKTGEGDDRIMVGVDGVLRVSANPRRPRLLNAVISKFLK